MKGITRILLLGCLLLALPAAAQADKFTPKLGQAWTWMEAGALDKADAAFKEVMADPEGRNLAEAHFGLAAVWWQKRNAMASYQRLAQAKAMSGQLGWMAGPDDMWDRRIEKRVEYIENNFTVVKLRAPSKAAVPPLADPRPNDPLLREFTEGLGAVVEESLAEGSLVQWLLLPNGDYWVGDRLETLEGGEMDPSRAVEWELDKGSGARATYRKRIEAIEAGQSPAKDYLAQGGGTTDPSARTGAVTQITQRSFGIAIQGGLAPTRELNELDPSVAPDWMLGVQLEGRIALPEPTLALSVSGGWKTLPVNGCRVAPTRGQLVSLGVGPSLLVPLATNASLGVDVGFRGGLLFGGRSDASRLSCVEKAVDAEDPTAVTRGGLASEGDVQSSFSLADLGWRGRAGSVGGELAVGPVLDGGGPLAFSVQLLLGYDHLIPILPGDDAPETLYLRDPRTGQVAAITRGQAVTAASMGRMQLGVRLRALF